MNVLSIDFDIIMAPDIPLYNHLIRGIDKNGKNLTVNTLGDDFPFLKCCRSDLGHFQKIFLHLVDILPSLNVEDNRVSYSHEDIKYLFSNSNSTSCLLAAS